MFIDGSQQFAAAERVDSIDALLASDRLPTVLLETAIRRQPWHAMVTKSSMPTPMFGPTPISWNRTCQHRRATNWRSYEKYKTRNKEGAVTYLMGERKYKRRLGLAGEAAPQSKEYMSGYKRHQHGNPNPLCERDPTVRIADMDLEGVDVNLMLPSGWFGCWTTIDDVGLETSVYEAYHRWMADYCAAFPERLKGVIVVAARDVKSFSRRTPARSQGILAAGGFRLRAVSVSAGSSRP